MDGTVPKIFYNLYLNFMNFLIFLNSRGPGSKFQISSGGGGAAATPLSPVWEELGSRPFCFVYSFIIHDYAKLREVAF